MPAPKSSDNPTSDLVIHLFGPMTVAVHGQPLPRLRSRKGLWLLALLTLKHARPVERDFLVGTLWPESSQTQALYNLRQSLSDLRTALGDQAVRLQTPTRHTLLLDLTGAEVDVQAFDTAMTSGEIASLERAIALYRGALLEGCQEEWAFQERQQREQAFLSALERVAQAAIESGEPTKATEYLRRAVGLDPLRESVQRALMQALAQQGDYASSVLAYREFRLLLHQQLHTQPDATTQALLQQIRAQARQARQPVSLPISEPAVADQSESKAEVWDQPANENMPPLELPEGTVTFLFTDIEKSSRLWEHDQKAMQERLERHDALLTGCIRRHNGHVFKGLGDGLCCVFASAPQAVHAALAIQQALQAQEWQEPAMRVRIALHTGQAQQRDGDYYGLPLNRVARLLSIGHGGQVLLSLATEQLVRESLPEGVSLRDLGSHRLRDLSQPEQVFQLVHPSLPAEFAALRSLNILPTNLPTHLTSFIGREKEIEEIKSLVAKTRLLTLTGSGGCGKTRLALQVAADLIEEYPDGVWLVEFAALLDPSLVVQAVAGTLGIKEEPGRPLVQTLGDALRSKRILLVLDNCEHLLQACASLAETLLKSCPPLRLMVTSREAFKMEGEQVYRVPSLLSPDPDDLPAEEKDLAAFVSEYEAPHLFVARANLQRSDFALTQHNAVAVASVCFRLDGIPLAIELAAARVNALSVEEINTRLEHRFRLLRGGSRSVLPRQQTLQATLDWSYELLSEPERLLLARLSVFVGGWTLEAAEAVCSDEQIEAYEALELLISLIDKSLVIAEEREGKTRYRLLETIREYARDRLQERAEETLLRERHLAFFLEMAEAVEAKLQGAEQTMWLQRLEAEHDNLRSALLWRQTQVDKSETGLRLAGSLQRFWQLRGHLSVGRAYLTRALEHERGGMRTPVRAKALNGAGFLAWCQADYEAARAIYVESLAIYRELDNNAGLSQSLNGLGLVTYVLGDYKAARELFEECLVIERALGDERGIAYCLVNLGNVAYDQSEYRTAKALFKESLAVFRGLEDKSGIAFSLLGLGIVDYEQSDYETAKAQYEESLAISRELGSWWGIANALHGLGNVASDRGDYETARALYQEELAIQQELGVKWGIAHALHGLGKVARFLGDYMAARTLMEQSLTLRQELGTKQGIAFSHIGLGDVAYDLSDYAAAKALYEVSLAIYRELGVKWGIATALNSLGNVACSLGDDMAARTLLEKSLTLRQELGDKWGIAFSLEAYARLAIRKDQLGDAVRLYGAAKTLREAIGSPLPLNEREEYERHLAAIRQMLGEEAFEQAWASGRDMTLEQAIAYALAEHTTA